MRVRFTAWFLCAASIVGASTSGATAAAAKIALSSFAVSVCHAAPTADLTSFALQARRSKNCIHTVQFDDDSDGVAGCVNECKLQLEICLGERPAGESEERCQNLNDQCQNKCYNN